MGKLSSFTIGAITGAAGVFGIKSYLRYRHDLLAAENRLKKNSRHIETTFGPIVYGMEGSGSPVLAVHGAGGGFDQALQVTRIFGNNFQWIAPARFGYLGTPLPENGSPIAQADAHAAFLDAMDIEQIPIIGMSAGGPSALQFALRHPDRCTGLVMVAAISHAMIDVIPNPEVLEIVLDGLLVSDWPVWLGLQLAIRKIRPPMGVPMKVIKQINPEDDAWLQTLLSYVLPVQPRRAGLLNDLRTMLQVEVYPLEQIRVPTLVIHAQDDSLVSIKHARFSAKYIPGARLVELTSGGHLLLGQREHVKAEVEPFLMEVTSSAL